MITEQEFFSRLAAVRKLMEDEMIDALIIGSSAQLDQRGLLRWLMGYYLPVFEETVVIPSEGAPIYFAHDALGAYHAANSPLHPEPRIISAALYLSDPAAPVAEYLRSIYARRIGIAGATGLSAHFFNSLTRHLNTVPIDVSWQVANLRMVKSPAEIALTRAAIKLNEDTLLAYVNEVHAGGYEPDALAVGYAFAALAGAEDQYWMSGSGSPAIVAPVAVAKSFRHCWQKTDYNFIVIEHSAPGGHFGEISQLLKIGQRDPELESAQSAVVEAILAAAEMIRPGNTVGQVAAAAERRLVAGGWMQPRSANTCAAPIGHGQGLDFWEIPSIDADNKQLIVPGMRFNLHPSVVMSDGNKVSYCDCYVSTQSAAERLSTLPYQVIYC